MPRRGSNSFKRNDGLRALRIARDAGLDVHGLEVVVGKNGDVTFRVFDKEAVGLLTVAPESMDDAKEWQAEIDALKGKAKRGAQ
jgi:hypothetical protein